MERNRKLKKVVLTEEEKEKFLLSGIKIKNIFRDISMSISKADQDLKFTYIDTENDSYKNLKNILGKRNDELFCLNESNLKILKVKQLVLETGQAKIINIVNPILDDNKVYQLLNEPIYNEFNDIIGVKTVSIDITEQHKLKNKLNITEERLRVALKNSRIIVAHCDLELRYTWIYNPHPDFIPKECIGKTDDELADNKGALVLKNLKRKVINTGEGKRKKIKFPLSDGDRYYDVTVEPLLDNNGKIIGATTASKDITEFKEIEQYLFNLKKLNSVSRLSYNVAHEFNNILGVIMATAQLSLKNTNKGKINNNNLQDKLNIILAECKKANKISSNLINMVKPGEMDKQKVLIQDIIDNVIQIQKNELIIEKISVVKEYNTNKKIFVDSSQMEEVFLNLIINARHAIKPKCGGEIKFSVIEKNNFIDIIIKDNGIGMDEKTKNQIFEPFFTTKGDCGNGSGLGLPIVLKIIEKHHGKIHVNSCLGKGTDIMIMFPVIDE